MPYRVCGAKEREQAAVTETKEVNERVERKQQQGGVAMTHPRRYFDYSEKSMQARERRGELCILRR